MGTVQVPYSTRTRTDTKLARTSTVLYCTVGKINTVRVDERPPDEMGKIRSELRITDDPRWGFLLYGTKGLYVLMYRNPCVSSSVCKFHPLALSPSRRGDDDRLSSLGGAVGCRQLLKR